MNFRTLVGKWGIHTVNTVTFHPLNLEPLEL